MYLDLYTAGYTEIDEVRRIQTDIWTTKNGGRLVWSGSLRSYDPITGDLVNTMIAKQILPETAKDAIFPAAPKR